MLRRDPGAAVGDPQPYIPSGAGIVETARVPFIENAVAGLEQDAAAVGHRVTRVDHQVEHRLFEHP